MTAISITAANVKPGSNAQIDRSRSAGATIAQGDAVYLDAATNSYKLASCNTAGAKSFNGIALSAASSGQPVDVQIGGTITIGGTVVGGTTYAVGETAGSIVPQADLTTGDDVIIIGQGNGTTGISLHPNVTGSTL